MKERAQERRRSLNGSQKNTNDSMQSDTFSGTNHSEHVTRGADLHLGENIFKVYRHGRFKAPHACSRSVNHRNPTAE